MIDFRILPLDKSVLSAALDNPASHARWIVADSDPGFPCRVSLQDATTGEDILAMTFTHHDVNSPYHASGPIFIRRSAIEAHPGVNEIPVMLRHRQLSLRGYNTDAVMIAAATVNGSSLEADLRKIFSDPLVEYVHIHNAGPGCFNCTAVRA